MNQHFEDLKAQVKLGQQVFIAPNATVIGDVTLGDQVSVWYNAVVRADHASIKIGARTNVQDGAIMHVDENIPVKIGMNNVIGHAAIIHGATIGNGCLIGMRATIMNNATIGDGCIIGAHALVTERMEVPDHSLVLGMPGKIVKSLDIDTVKRIQDGVSNYITEAARYLGI